VGRLVLRRWLVGTTEETDPFDTDPLAGIAPAVVLDTPELALVAAAEACRWGRREDAELYRSRVDQARPPRGGELARIWSMARRLLDVTFGWTFGTDARARAALAELHAVDTFDAWTPRVRQLAALAQAEMEIDAGHLDRARHSLGALADHGGPEWHRVLAAAVLAVLDAAAGDLRAAERRLGWVRTQLESNPAHPTTVHFAEVAAALCAAQRGEVRAVAEALAGEGASSGWSSRSVRCVDRALQAATRGRAPFFVSLDAPTARHPLAERALLALGVLDVVDAKGRTIELGGEGERAVAEARRLLPANGVSWTGGAPAQVEARFDRSVPHHPRTGLEATVLAVIAAEGRNDHAAADHLLGEAFDAAAATGIRAPLVDHGPELIEVLQRASGDVGPRATAALDLLGRQQTPGGGPLVEPLTDREIEVLQYLPTLMSNSEIARGLHLSVNTVKSHLKSLYRKLGVDGRRAAVLRGRESGLL
jgi:DNA-binding CsgD family transcriptional regulator